LRRFITLCRENRTERILWRVIRCFNRLYNSYSEINITHFNVIYIKLWCIKYFCNWWNYWSVKITYFYSIFEKKKTKNYTLKHFPVKKIYKKKTFLTLFTATIKQVCLLPSNRYVCYHQTGMSATIKQVCPLFEILFSIVNILITNKT
jgi:hypothetical protein